MSKRVLLLSPYPERLASAFSRADDTFFAATGPIDQSNAVYKECDWIVAYGYRHMIRGPLLDEFHERIVNLHIALLPWNRGADPNFWSWYDDTPKGVTIHFIDSGLDTGDIVAQNAVEFTGAETLRDSYGMLCRRVEMLFTEVWPILRAGRIISREQSRGGTYHRKSDKEALFRSLALGWDTPVADVEMLGRLQRQEKS